MKNVYCIIPLFVPTWLLAQSEPVDTSLYGMIQEGGWAMIPLGLCSLALIFLAIYGFMETRRSRFIPDVVLPQVKQQIAAHDISSANETLSGSSNVLARALSPALLKLRSDRPNLGREQAETLLVENLEAEENSLSQWINYLNVVAAVAPMIGLLGTVSGMISAFQTIGQGGMGRPELLAADIGEALITTATGLVIGIPAMIIYFILRNRLGHQMIQTTQTASELLEEIEEGPV